MDIKGDTRCFTNFAVDLLNREIIIINLKTTGDRVASMRQVLATKKYLNDAYLNYSMYDVLSHRGEVIDNIEEAEIVFSRDYTPKENQKVIRPYDIAALVEIINQ